MKNLGIIGYPIGHSMSPHMHNAVIKALGLDYTYIAMSVKPEDIKAAVLGLRALNFRGFNVTIPHKIAIMEHIDEINQGAKAIGAVNTVVNNDGKLRGYNTDYIGFVAPLKKMNFSIKDKNALVLGAGGAARAVLWGLISEEASHITVVGRNKEKLNALRDQFKEYFEIEIIDWNEDKYAERCKTADIIINTTPIGMHPQVDACPPIDWLCVNKKALAYDLIYTPAVTQFLAQAKKNGNTILNGEGMLVEQGAAAFKMWTSRDALTQVMHDVLVGAK
ncbi:MAG: Shikimate dehydrogenase [Massilibacillus sp.]|jgi:shikimate dehydrogenase|nr:Shikimate dehydrogenase [Massilibacillus sp.]